jgi:hypothetical protein
MGRFDCINKIMSYYHTNLMSFSCYNVQINYVAMVTSCHTICFFHFQNVELQTMATVVLRVVPVIQLILPTVTTLIFQTCHQIYNQICN